MYNGYSAIFIYSIQNNTSSCNSYFFVAYSVFYVGDIMRESIKKNIDYKAIINFSEWKRKQQLYQIQKHCCISCVNCGKDCLKLEHTLQDSTEVYRCVNYVQKQAEAKEEKVFRKDIKMQNKK